MTDNAFEHRAAALRQRAELTGKSLGLQAMAAEDIAQDVMLKLWAMRGELEERNLDALATIMARRLALNRFSAEKKAIAINVELHSEASKSPAEILEEKENEQWLERRLSQLPRTQNIILRMRQAERRSLKEIAQLLGIEESSVSTLLARSRRALLDEIRKRNRR